MLVKDNELAFYSFGFGGYNSIGNFIPDKRIFYKNDSDKEFIFEP